MYKLTILTVAVALLSACGGNDNSGTPALSSDATLMDLSIAAGTFDQIFQSSQPDYTATVTLLRSTTTVTVRTAHPNASVLVDEVAVISGATSDKVTLSHGSNAINVVVTAEDGVTTETYSIEVTRQTIASFAQQAYVKASNTEGAPPGSSFGDWFGWSIALSKDTLAVSAPFEGSAATGINGDQFNNDAAGSGAVYIFVRDQSGSWSQQAYVKSPSIQQSGKFGSALDLDGDTLVVAHRADSIKYQLHIYTRDEFESWSLQDSISAPDFGTVDGSDRFGFSLALSGDTLAVGAPYEDSFATGINGNESDDSAVTSGAVYVFSRDTDGNWSRQAFIKPSNTNGAVYDPVSDEFIGGDRFGTFMALDGNTLAVGAGTGAVYLFVRMPGANWSEQALINGSSTSIAIYGNTLAIGSQFESSNATGVDGDQDNIGAPASGAVYIYVRDEDNDWNQQAYIKSSNSETWDTFGNSLGLSEDALAVGAKIEDSAATGVDGDQLDNSALSSGAVYLFTRNAVGAWTQDAYVKSSNTAFTDIFGATIDLDGDIVAVGAYHEDSGAIGIGGDQADNSEENSGAVYVFE